MNKGTLLKAFKEVIDSGDIYGALEDFHYEYTSHPSTSPDDHAFDEDMYEEAVEALEKRWKKFSAAFKPEFESSRLVVWRQLLLGDKKLKNNGVGVYWSWTKEKARSWWGDNLRHKREKLLKGLVALDAIDIPLTLASNLFKEHIEETEIRLKKGAKVQLLEPRPGDATAKGFLRKVHGAYTVTETMRRVAYSSGGFGTVKMDPRAFLILTTDHPPDDSVRRGILKRAKEWHEYEGYGTDGEIRVMPFLRYARGTGKVRGHEGRHRAVAAWRHGDRWIEVALKAEPVRQHFGEREPEDYPERLYNQYETGVSVDMLKWHGTFTPLTEEE